ncbi:MAG: radical SAM protein [Desulfobacterales bacterium]|nr:radical SAM protein [Desulfobacterales bacterium]
MLLIYPNTYHVGMSNLGFQAVYTLFNKNDHIVCERFFLPDTKPFACKQFTSLESHRSFSDFNIIAFSLSFENDYLNLLDILSFSKIPINSKDRDSNCPLIIAGGVACMLNPEPVHQFVDCFLIGEAEDILPEFIDNFSLSISRKTCLKNLATKVPGIYVPQFYKDFYNKDHTLRSFEPIEDVPDKISRRYVKDLSNTSTYSALLTPNTAFSSTFLIEVGRGCYHGCRFCAAGYIYRPPRFRSSSHIKECFDHAFLLTNKIGLVGSAVSDLPGLIDLCASAYHDHRNLSFSSIRADALTPELAAALHNCGVKTATIAPEGGSERIRKVINKGITESDIIQATELLVTAGIPNLKLYFMIGLPTETMEDIEAIVNLCQSIKNTFLAFSRPKKKIGNISVSLNPFVPKPFTPFQWAPIDHEQSLKVKINSIKKALKAIPNVNLQIEKPRSAYIQTLFSRGNRNVSFILKQALKNHGNWTKTLKTTSIDPDFFTYREIPVDELLPWDFIDHRIHKHFLQKEYKNAIRGLASAPCHMDDCNICGVCKHNSNLHCPTT